MPDTIEKQKIEEREAIDFSQPHENAVIDAARQRLILAKEAIEIKRQTLMEEEAHKMAGNPSHEDGGLTPEQQRVLIESRVFPHVARDIQKVKEQEKLLIAAVTLFPLLAKRGEWAPSNENMEALTLSRQKIEEHIPPNAVGLDTNGVMNLLRETYMPGEETLCSLLAKALDVGGSNISVTLFSGKDLHAVFEVPEAMLDSSTAFARTFLSSEAETSVEGGSNISQHLYHDPSRWQSV